MSAMLNFSSKKHKSNHTSENDDNYKKHVAICAFLSKWIYDRVENLTNHSTAASASTSFASPVASDSHIQVKNFFSRIIYGKAENPSNTSFESPSTTTATSPPTTIESLPPTTKASAKITFAGPVSVDGLLSEEYIHLTDEYRNELCTFAIVTSAEAIYLVFRGSVTPMDFLIGASLSPEKVGDYWITSNYYAILKTVADIIHFQLEKVIGETKTKFTNISSSFRN
eukprot:gene55609-76209_t